MAKPNLKTLLVIMNIFLAVSIVINTVLIFKVLESQNNVDALAKEVFACYDKNETAQSETLFSYAWTPVPIKMCQSVSGCLSEETSLQNFYYSSRISTGEDIRKSAINAIIKNNEHQDLCEPLMDSLSSLEFTYCQELVSLYYWVRDEITYVTGPLEPDCQTASETLVFGAGKCDEQAVLLVSLLKSIGIESWVGLVDTSLNYEQCLTKSCSANTADHAVVIVRLQGLSQLDSSLDYWHVGGDQNIIVLDPSCINCEFGELPSSVLGKVLWVLQN